MLQTVVTQTSIFDRMPGRLVDPWDRIAGHPLAAAAFVDVCARYPAPGFRTQVVRHDQGDRLTAGAALFTCDLRLDMPFGATTRAFGDWLMRVAPAFIRVPMICVGSPISDTCPVVVDPALDKNERRRALAAIIDATLDLALQTKAHVIAVKDLADGLKADADDVLAERGFSRMESLPVAVLDLPFASVDDYLASLSPKMRSDIRRKMRQSKAVEITIAPSASGLEDDLHRLLTQTRNRRKADYGDFDDIPAGFMPALLAAMGPSARLVITRVDGRIAGFNLFLTQGTRAVAFRIGLDYDLVREHNLYFANWMWMVRFCIENGLTELEMGQTSYPLKLRLGCRLQPSWFYIRHRMTGWNSVVKLIAPRVSIARMDPDLHDVPAA